MSLLGFFGFPEYPLVSQVCELWFLWFVFILVLTKIREEEKGHLHFSVNFRGLGSQKNNYRKENWIKGII